MRVKLRDLHPNPTRDFKVDPLDKASVAKLRRSIKQSTFWSGIVARKNGDGYQIAAGHHRIAAAIAEGITEADIVVHDFDDYGLLVAYGNENLTQRGTDSTAIAGVVAGAVRQLARKLANGECIDHGSIHRHAWKVAAGQFQSGKGIGYPLLTQYLAPVEGISEKLVRQQIGLLKDSGHYARIIAEVEAELRAEAEAAEKEAEQAEKQKARDAKAKREAATTRKTAAERGAKARTASANGGTVFDLDGVSKVIRNRHHLDVFRRVVTGKGMAPYLPVDQQVRVAKALVKEVGDGELSGLAIREYMGRALGAAMAEARTFDREQQAALMQSSLAIERDKMLWDLQNHAWSVVRVAARLTELRAERWPPDKPWAIPPNITRALTALRESLNDLPI